MGLLPRFSTRQSLGQRVRHELQLVDREIREGRFQRSMAIMAAISSIVSGFEAYIQHLRGAFNHWPMWTPVLITFPMTAAAGASFFSHRAARRALPAVSLISLVDGIIGFIFHLRGIRRMPGGLKLGQYNIVMGPPIFAPLLLSSAGVLGMIAGLLRPERLDVLRGKSIVNPPSFTFLPVSTKREGLPARLAADISNGRFQQVMALTSAFFAGLSGGEAYFEHMRGSYNQRVMWTPVWVTLPTLLSAIAAVRSERMARRILPITSALSLIDGLVGFFFHLRGVRNMPGGFRNTLFNITLGPPLFAPLLFSAVGLLGFVAALLRRR